MSSQQRTERRFLARALAGTALLLAVLLAIVALASRGQSQWGAGSGSTGVRPALPAGAYSYLYAGFLLAGALAVPLFFYVYTRTTAYERARRARRRLAATGILFALALVLLVVAPSLRHSFSDAFARLELFHGRLGAEPGARAVRPPAPDSVALAIVSSIAAAGGGGLFAARVVRRRRRASAPLVATLSFALDESLDDLRSEPDARRAIIVAYARMEVALERSGVGRDRSEAPLEYLARVLLALDVAPAPVRALTDLFERAKFSQHQLGADAKAEAIGALERIRDDLRAFA